jgi:hypothetical protein
MSLAFGLPGTLLNIGSHSIEKANSFRCEFSTFLGFNSDEAGFLKLLQGFPDC